MIERELSSEEVEIIQKFRTTRARRITYNSGTEAAATVTEDWAEQCCGGSGEGGEPYRLLAAIIRKKFLLNHDDVPEG